MRLWLDRRALAVIEREALKRRLVETGGALFGYEGDVGVVVACAFGPGLRAKHGPRSFVPDRTTTAALMRLVREASETRYRFLGSWHTHPRGSALPSAVDRRTAADMSDQKDLLLPKPLVVIQATRGLRREVGLADLRGWRWQARERQLTEIALELFELEHRFYPPDDKLQALGLA